MKGYAYTDVLRWARRNGGTFTRAELRAHFVKMDGKMAGNRISYMTRAGLIEPTAPGVYRLTS
jgi:hypothetical protein